MLDRLGEYVDRIVNSKLTPHLRTHDAATFYGPARVAQGNQPVTYLAAAALLERVKEGDYVFILHNAGIAPYLPHGETDGPLGAVSLARALNWGLGAQTVFIGEPGFREPIERCAVAAGLRIVSRENVETYKVYHGAQVIDFPLGPEGAPERAAQLLNSYKPVAILAVERLGPNGLNRFHSGVGYPLPDASQAHVHLLMEEVNDAGFSRSGSGTVETRLAAGSSRRP